MAKKLSKIDRSGLTELAEEVKKMPLGKETQAICAMVLVLASCLVDLRESIENVKVDDDRS